MTDSSQFDELTAKINRETAKIRWSELQKFFAQGRALHVTKGQDLVQIAKWMAEDNAEALKPLMSSGKLGQVNDQTATQWLEDDQLVWAVVSAPWVLVQALS